MSALNQKIELGRGSRYPSKQSINLFIEEKHTKQNVLALCLFGVYLVALWAFVHFVILSQLDEMNRLEAEYNRMQQTVLEAQEANSNYEEVRAEYSHYGNGYLNDDEQAQEDRLDILAIIEEQLLDKDALQNIDITGNTATLTINSEKLANVSDIVAELEQYEIVEYVTVSSSQTNGRTVRTENEDGEITEEYVYDVVTLMTINFRSAVEVAAEREAAAQADSAESGSAAAEAGTADQSGENAAEAGNEGSAQEAESTSPGGDGASESSGQITINTTAQ